MVRLGAFLCLLGFGSAVLHFTDLQFRLLVWPGAEYGQWSADSRGEPPPEEFGPRGR